MKTTRVTIRWDRGLHMRTAVRLVRLAQQFRSQIRLRLGPHMADARSILNLMILSASLGASVEIEAIGNDEYDAVKAVEEFFANPDSGDNLSLDETSES